MRCGQNAGVKLIDYGIEEVERAGALWHQSARQTFRHFYGPYWTGSPVFWRRQGFLGLNPETKIVDNQWVINAFLEGGLNKPFSRRASLVLFYCQVIAAKKYTKYKDVLWEEEIYDYLQARSFGKSCKFMYGKNGRLTKRFTDNPIPVIVNVMTKRISQCIYDLHRRDLEAKAHAGDPGYVLKTPLPDERARRMKMRTAYLDPNEACDRLDKSFYAGKNSWADFL